ncbi:MAG: hypothetical protein E7269_06955 [Lachnospiraceae bacterium]|nr:hypothetical protein [Lachnospiraceae bacterium]
MKFRRLFAVLMAVMMIATLFAGCRKQDADNDVKNEPKTEKDIVYDAFLNTFGVESKLASELNILARQEAMANGAAEAGATITLDMLSGLEDLEGLAVSMEVEADEEASESYVKLGTAYGDDELAAEIYFDGEKLYAGSDDLLGDNVLTLNLAEDLLTQMQNSPLFSSMLEDITTDAEDIFESLPDYMEQSKEISAQMKTLFVGFADSEAVKEFNEDLTIAKGEKESFAFGDEDVDCQGYEVKIAANDLAKFICAAGDYFVESDALEAYADYMYDMTGEDMGLEDIREEWALASAALEEELEDALKEYSIVIYIYDETVVAIDVAVTVGADDMEETITITYKNNGGSNGFANAEIEVAVAEAVVALITEEEVSEDEITSTMVIEVSDAAYSVKVLEGEVTYNTDDATLSATIAIADEAEVTLEAEVTENTKSRLGMNISELTISAYDEDLLILSMEVFCGELTDGVTSLEGTELDIMTATEDDVMSLLTTAQTALGGMTDFAELINLFVYAETDVVPEYDYNYGY